VSGECLLLDDLLVTVTLDWRCAGSALALSYINPKPFSSEVRHSAIVNAGQLLISQANTMTPVVKVPILQREVSKVLGIQG
jgi:hypothetical protein